MNGQHYSKYDGRLTILTESDDVLHRDFKDVRTKKIKKNKNTLAMRNGVVIFRFNSE